MFADTCDACLAPEHDTCPLVTGCSCCADTAFNAPEVGLTEAERRALWVALCGDRFSLDHVLSSALEQIAPVVARIKADAIAQERAAWVAKIEALAAEWSALVGMLRRNQSYTSDVASVDLQRRAIELRALLSSDATEEK